MIELVELRRPLPVTQYKQTNIEDTIEYWI